METLRKLLLKKREDTLKAMDSEAAKFMKHDGREIGETALDEGDLSVMGHDEDLKLKQMGGRRDVIVKIDESLRKIDEGTYGVCDDCGEEISAERLRILPFAIRCRDCQEAEEERESAELGETIVYDM